MTMTKKLAIALFVSLALNLFLGGAIAARLALGRSGAGIGPGGMGMGRGMGMGMGPRGPGAGPGRVMGPPEVRVIRDVARVMGGPADPRVRRLFADARTERREMRLRIDATHAALRDAIASEPFDRERLDRALDALDAETRSAEADARQKLRELASELTASERQTLRESGAPLASSPPGD